MNESKRAELTALVEWIKTFPQLQYLRDEKENSNSPDLLEDPQVTSSIFDIALEVYDCDGDETTMTHSGEVWDNVLSLTRKTSKRKLLDGIHSNDCGVDARYDALTSLLHGAVSHPDMKVRADYVGRITKMPDKHTQKSLMDMIARQKQDIEGNRKEKKIKRSHAVHDEASTPARRISKSSAKSARKPLRTPFTPKSSRQQPCESDECERRSLFTTPQRKTPDDDSLRLEGVTKPLGFMSPGLGDTAEYEKEVQDLREQNDQLLSTIAKYKENEEDMKSKYEQMEVKYRNEMMKIEAAAGQRNEEIQEELQGEIKRLEKDISDMLKQMEANEEAKAELDTIRDEMEVMKHTKSLLDDTSERLNHYKEKLTQLTDIKDALEKEEEAHSRSVDENIRLKNELSSLYSMKRNLDEYKTRAVEAEVRFTEVHDELTKLTKKLNDTANERENLSTVVQSQQEEIENLRRQTRHKAADESGGGQVGIGLSELNPEIKEELLKLRNENVQLREFADKREDDAVMKLELQVEDTNRLAERYKSQFLSTKGMLETAQCDLEKSIARERKLHGDHTQTLEESSRMKMQLDKTTLELTKTRQNLDESRSRESMLEEELSSWVEQARALQDRTDEMAKRLHICNENLENAQSREVILKGKIEDLELNIDKYNRQTSCLSRQLEVQGKKLHDSNELCEELSLDLSEWIEKAKSTSDLANDISDNLADCSIELQESMGKNDSLKRKLANVSKVLQATELKLKEEQQRLCGAHTKLKQNERIIESAKQREQRLQSDLQSANEEVEDTLFLLDKKNTELANVERTLSDALEEKQQLLKREELLAIEVHQFQANAEKMSKQLACIQHDADTFNQEKCEALSELQKSQEEILSLGSRINEIESALEKSKSKGESYMQQTQSLESKLVETEEHVAELSDTVKKLRKTETETKESLNDFQRTIGDLNEKLQEERKRRATIEEEMKLSCDTSTKMEADLNASIEDMRIKWQEALNIAGQHKHEITRLNEVLNESQSSLSAANHRENMLHHKIRVLEDNQSELESSIQATRDTANKEVLEATQSFQASREILNAKATKDVEEVKKKMSLFLEEERRRNRQIESDCKEKLKQMECEVADAKNDAVSIIDRTKSDALVRYQEMQKEYDEIISKLKEDANRESTQLVRKGKGMLKELKIKQLEEKGKLKNQIKLLEERCSAISKENETAITNCNAKVREYRKKLQFASGRITQLTTESDDLEGQIETLSRESSKLREENDRYRRQLGGRFGSESNAQNEMLRKELQSACDEIRELKRQKGGVLPSPIDGPGGTQRNYHIDLASQSTISQLRTEYEETIEALNDEKRELVMKNAAAMTDVQKAEMRAWETENENSALNEELVSLRLQLERLGKNCTQDQPQNTEGEENISKVKSTQLSQTSPRNMHRQDEAHGNSNSTGQSTQVPTVFLQHHGSLAPNDESPPECTQS